MKPPGRINGEHGRAKPHLEVLHGHLSRPRSWLPRFSTRRTARPQLEPSRQIAVTTVPVPLLPLAPGAADGYGVSRHPQLLLPQPPSWGLSPLPQPRWHLAALGLSHAEALLRATGSIP